MQDKGLAWLNEQVEKSPKFVSDIITAKSFLTPEELKECERLEYLRYRFVARQGPENGYKPYKMTKAEQKELRTLLNKYRSVYFTQV